LPLASMADWQVILCQPLLPNHHLSSASKAVVASPLVSSHHLLLSAIIALSYG
jgi:hypothetical protein